MAIGKMQTFGPVAIPQINVTNLIAPAAAGAGAVGYTATADYLIIRHIRIVNSAASEENFKLYKGATGAEAAGTEFMGWASPVGPNSSVDWYGYLRLEGANGFLTGYTITGDTHLTLTAEGEIGHV